MNPMPFPRSSGLLLHITSLPGRYGIGDFGGALGLLDRLADAGQRYWQLLPLGPTGFADSPYQTLSSFAGNTLLINLEELQTWLPAGILDDHAVWRTSSVMFETVVGWRDEMLSLAYEGFLADRGVENRDYRTFCAVHQGWLDSFALYMAIKEAHGLQPWHQWPTPLALGEAKALEQARERYQSRIEEHRFRQWLFFRQWQQLREAAHTRGIQIIGDVPIYVAHDSCDVWMNRELFDLYPDGAPRLIAGVPPDYFSATGQLWGNPLYRWEAHQHQGFRWWKQRLDAALDLFDLVRIDHFRAFYNYWEIPAPAETAQGGRWVDGPRDQLFDALATHLQHQRNLSLSQSIIAEDLGDAMEAVRAWRSQLGLAGMKILQFAFGDNDEERARFTPVKWDGSNDDLAILYSGTHDNTTAAGWWFHESLPHQRERLITLARQWHNNPRHIIESPHQELIQIGMESADRVFILPMQDLLGRGVSSRMNRPGITGGNWRWRCTQAEFEAAPWQQLESLTRQNGRA